MPPMLVSTASDCKSWDRPKHVTSHGGTQTSLRTSVRNAVSSQVSPVDAVIFRLADSPMHRSAHAQPRSLRYSGLTTIDHPRFLQLVLLMRHGPRDLRRSGPVPHLQTIWIWRLSWIPALCSFSQYAQPYLEARGDCVWLHAASLLACALPFIWLNTLGDAKSWSMWYCMRFNPLGETFLQQAQAFVLFHKAPSITKVILF